jgi:hypothetical protein
MVENEHYTGKEKYLGKDRSQCDFAHLKSHIVQSRINRNLRD